VHQRKPSRLGIGCVGTSGSLPAGIDFAPNSLLPEFKFLLSRIDSLLFRINSLFRRAGNSSRKLLNYHKFSRRIATAGGGFGENSLLISLLAGNSGVCSRVVADARTAEGRRFRFGCFWASPHSSSRRFFRLMKAEWTGASGLMRPSAPHSAIRLNGIVGRSRIRRNSARKSETMPRSLVSTVAGSE
jgi:hypothetical protein